KTVPESKIVETLIEEAMKIAEQMEADGVTSGAPTGTGKPAVTVG
ncbi:4-hydroxy-3-methylbut-2-en-1-yl diphosphate synthase, partial [Streptomyces hirsutus]